MPWLSVVVPTFNRARYLGACLTSLREQSCPDWECLIVDDGSTDGSGALAERFAAQDGRFRYQHQANAGVSAARNAGLAGARGDWIAFLDSDDLYFRGAVERFKLASALCEQRGLPTRIISGQLVSSGEEPAAPGAAPALSLRDLFFRVLGFSRQGRSMLLQNTIFHRSALEAMGGGFSTDLPTAEDRELLIRAAAAADVVMLPSLVAYYRTNHGGGKSDQHRATGGKLRAHRQIYAALDRVDVVRRRLAARGGQVDFERLRQAYLRVLDAAERLSAGDGEGGAHHLEAAVRLCRHETERQAMVRVLSFFFLFPTAEPRTAYRRSRQALAALRVHLDPGGSAHRSVEELIRQQGEVLGPLTGRHALVPDPAAEPGAGTVVADSLTAWPEGGGPSTRFVARPVTVAALPGGRALLHGRQLGALATDRDVAAVVQGCSAFRTLEQHVQVAVARGSCRPDRQQAVLAGLEEIRARGGLVDAETALATPSAPAPAIAHLAVEADRDLDRAAGALAGYLENAARHGRQPTVFVVDAAAEADGAVRAASFAQIARRWGMTTVYLGTAARRAQAGRLAAAAELPEELAATALQIGLNGVLLETRGTAVMVVRAGSRCHPARLQDERPGLLLTGSSAFVRTLAFDSRAALVRQLIRSEVDMLGAHQAVLGCSPGALVARHPWTEIDGPAAQLLASERAGQPIVTATMSSAYGALGDEDPLGPLLSRDMLDPGLFASAELYRRLTRHEHVWKGVAQLTVGRVEALDLRATTLWNRPDAFAPLLPFLDQPETVFGWMAAALDGDARFAQLPVAINLEIDPPGDGQPDRIWSRVGFAGFPELLEACLLTQTRGPGPAPPVRRLAAMGEHLDTLARLPAADLLALVRPLACSWVSGQLLTVEALLQVHGEPRPWADDARRYLDALAGSLQREPGATGAGGIGLEQARGQLAVCGQLLSAWPQLAAAADQLRARGEGVCGAS
jgi:glycosyltransferase involved in cell wall biosynthesis